jgi:SAM-dependent methyltransferase
MKEPKKTKSPWPTKEAMNQVYAKNLWGGKSSEFYSGEGSHIPEIVTPYLEVVTSFLTSFAIPLTVCDLGCGDFNVGKELVKHTKKYIAVDIVTDLVERNKEKFKDENLEFQCLDIAVDELPSGDCAIVRQVLQHLSNAEVKAVLNKLSDFKYLILTEHLPIGNFTPNEDIISGQGIRLKKGSGIAILSAPFHFKVQEEKEMLTILLKDQKGKLTTSLYTI